MTEQEQLLQEIRDRLSKMPKGAPPFDPVAVVNELATAYSIRPEEIYALVIKEADAASINHV
jgi:hypothetical protein